MKTLTLEQARVVIASTLSHSRDLGLQPLTVVVLDAGGHVLAIEREDGATSLRVPIATGKASGALGLGISSRDIAAMAAERPQFLNAIASLVPGGVVPAAGGLVIRTAEGQAIGAVGVSGDASDADEACAAAGIAALHLEELA